MPADRPKSKSESDFLEVRQYGLGFTSLIGTRYGAVLLLSHRLTLRGRPAAASRRVLRLSGERRTCRACEPRVAVPAATARHAAAEMGGTLPEGLQELSGVEDGGGDGGAA